MKSIELFEEKGNRGITLVALVVTIVVLIILATISVNMAFGNDGLLSKARDTKKHQLGKVASKEKELSKSEAEYANAMAGSTEIKLPGETIEPGGPTGLPEITPTTQAGTEVKKASDWSTQVKAISDGSGNAIPLPNGFYYVGGNRADGLVISDNESDKDKGTSYDTASTLSGNQFVWVPVDNETALTRTEFDTTTGQPTTEITNYIEPSGLGYSDGAGTEEKVDFNNMKTQVLKYKGFYIGRYEAGDSNAGTTLRTGATTAHVLVLKKGVAPYNYIPWGKSISDISEVSGQSGAVYLATHMYEGKVQADSIVSTLCYGCQWDAMCRYIGDAHKTIKSGTLGLTGSRENDVSKNIYDITTNCREWTMEITKTKIRLYRGGYCNAVGAYPISYRSSASATIDQKVSFRPTLYIK